MYKPFVKRQILLNCMRKSSKYLSLEEGKEDEYFNATCLKIKAIFSNKKLRPRFSYHMSTKFWSNNNVTIKTITIQ